MAKFVLKTDRSEETETEFWLETKYDGEIHLLCRPIYKSPRNYTILRIEKDGTLKICSGLSCDLGLSLDEFNQIKQVR